MKNINRDYIVDVNVKNSTVSAGNNMRFYITDINTSNIYFKLNINESSSSLLNTNKLEENSDDYKLILRVIKPNNEPFEVEATRLDQPTNFFVVDLPNEYKDYIGTYLCELFIDTEIHGRHERSTTNSFTYEVIKSIMNNLDDNIENDPDFPIIDTFVTDEELAGYSKIDHTHDEYITQEDLGNIDISGTSYDDTELRKLIAKKVDSNNSTLNGCIDIGGFNEPCNDSVTIGSYNRTEYIGTIAIGRGNITTFENQIVMGTYNKIDTSCPFIIGDGYYYDEEEYRSNCMTIDTNGNCWHKGNLYVGGTQQSNAKQVLSTDDIYFDSEGYLVVKIGNKTKRFMPVD